MSVQTALRPEGQSSFGVEGYIRCRPGQVVTSLRCGDFILIRGPGWLGWLIRLSARVRLRKDDRRYGYWSHAALVVNDRGHLLEVHARGVGLCRIEKFRANDFCYVRLALGDAARQAAARYAYGCLGQRYDIGGFLWLALSVVLGDRLRVPDTGRPGCISLIVRALERAGLCFERPAPEMTPADLAKKFGVLP
jgi:hypothetical protein